MCACVLQLQGGRPLHGCPVSVCGLLLHIIALHFLLFQVWNPCIPCLWTAAGAHEHTHGHTCTHARTRISMHPCKFTVKLGRKQARQLLQHVPCCWGGDCSGRRAVWLCQLRCARWGSRGCCPGPWHEVRRPLCRAHVGVRTGGRGSTTMQHRAFFGKAIQLTALVSPPIGRTVHAGFPPSSYPVLFDINLNQERASHLLDYLLEGSFFSRFATTRLTLKLASFNIKEQLYGWVSSLVHLKLTRTPKFGDQTHKHAHTHARTNKNTHSCTRFTPHKHRKPPPPHTRTYTHTQVHQSHCTVD